MDDIGNLEDSPRLVFINEERGNLIVVNDDGESTENIATTTRVNSATTYFRNERSTT